MIQPTKKSRILVIEDRSNTQRFLESMSGTEFEVLGSGNGILGIEAVRTQAPDLVILDLDLPLLSGYDTCSLLKKDRRTKHIPIILICSAGNQKEFDRTSYRADEYLCKPFDYKELLAKIRLKLAAPEDQAPEQICFGELIIDPANRDVLHQGKKTHLTLTEFEILTLLAENRGKVVSREQILQSVWKDPQLAPSDRTIDVHIRALRRKLPSIAEQILSVYGVGYQLDFKEPHQETHKTYPDQRSNAA